MAARRGAVPPKRPGDYYVEAGGGALDDAHGRRRAAAPPGPEIVAALHENLPSQEADSIRIGTCKVLAL